LKIRAIGIDQTFDHPTGAKAAGKIGIGRCGLASRIRRRSHDQQTSWSFSHRAINQGRFDLAMRARAAATISAATTVLSVIFFPFTLGLLPSPDVTYRILGCISVVM